MATESGPAQVPILRPVPEDYVAASLPHPFKTADLELRDRLPLRLLGAHMERVPPLARTCPLHAHLLEEEVFYLLDGELTVREIDRDGSGTRYTLRAGEAVVYPAGTGIAHGFSNDSQRDAVFLALSDERWGEVCFYPESGKTLLRPLGRVGVFGEGAEDAAEHVGRDRTREWRELADEQRPAHVVPVGPMRDLDGPSGRRISAAGGAQRVMLNHDRLPPGTQSAPLHWHSGDEELVLVVSGTPTLRTRAGTVPPPNPRGTPAPVFDGEDALRPLSRGDVLYFGPHVPLAHQIVNHGEEPAELLVVGLRDPADITVLPEQGELVVRLLEQRGPFTPTGYFDGEV